MGGDPLWNDALIQWGRITFAVSPGGAIEIEGHSCANQSVTYCHVLCFGQKVGASTTRYPNSMKLQWATQPPGGDKCIDLAGTDMISGAFQDKKLSKQFVKDLRAVGVP